MAVRRLGRGRAAAGLTALLLAGCVERGDFGRVKPSVWNDVVGATGGLAAAGRGEPVSSFPFTDDEAELRARAWRFLVPAKDAGYGNRLLAELVATRILPASMRPDDERSYFAALLDDDARSPASRYRRLSEDAAADGRLLGAFAPLAARVLSADAVRTATLDYATTLERGEVGDAFARVAENRCLIAWVKAGYDGRLRAYGYALQHLVIAAPQGDAVPAERALARFRQDGSLLTGLAVPPLAAAACLGEARPQPAAISRQPVAATPRPPPPALVTKG